MEILYSKIYKQLVSKASSAPLSELFPLVLQIAKVIQRKDLEKWALLEFNGYFNTNPALTKDVIVPKYRTVPGQRKDEFGRPLILEDQELSFINEDRLRQGVSELEQLAKSQK